MTRNSICAAVAGGIALVCAALSPAEAGQELVSLQSGKFIDRCKELGIVSGGGSNYKCTSPPRADGVASISCTFNAEDTLCSWPEGSDGFAHSLIKNGSTRGITIDSGSISQPDPAPRVLLPSFGGRKAGRARP